MERAVLDQLLDYFRARLSRYPTTLTEDDALVLLGLINFIHSLR